MDTLLLDRTTWDLVQDANGNIAVASSPYALGQDAASAIRVFGDSGPNFQGGESYWDTTLGVPYLTVVFWGPRPSVSLLKQLMVEQAMTVPGVASAQCFIEEVSDRGVRGQVQVTPASGAPVQAVNFTVLNPQGIG